MTTLIIGNKWLNRIALTSPILAVLSGLTLQAEEIGNSWAMPAPQERPATVKNPPITVTTGLAEQFNSNVDKGGSMSVTRFQAGLMVPFRLTDALVVNTSFKFGFDSYDFSSMQGQWQGPWHNINTYTLASILQGTINDQWSIYGGGLVRESGETSAKFTEGYTGGGIIGVNFKCSDTLTIGGGLGIMSQLENHVLVLPLLTANWRFANNWHLKIGLTDVATTGYGAEVAYDVSQNWELGLGLQHQKSRFRIEGGKYQIGASGKLYDRSLDGIGQEEATALYTEATWHATSALDVNAYLGITVGGNIRVENNTGTEIYSSDYNTAAIVGLDASLRF
jgi:long-subunit fatty acid transport protein